MTVAELIEKLQTLPDNHQVCIFDGNIHVEALDVHEVFPNTEEALVVLCAKRETDEDEEGE